MGQGGAGGGQFEKGGGEFEKGKHFKLFQKKENPTKSIYLQDDDLNDELINLKCIPVFEPFWVQKIVFNTHIQKITGHKQN